MMDILSENSKKIFKFSYRALKARGKKIVQGVCYFINTIPKFILRKEKEVNVQNISSILTVDILKNGGATADNKMFIKHICTLLIPGSIYRFDINVNGSIVMAFELKN
jgi:hypothetical protein